MQRIKLVLALSVFACAAGLPATAGAGVARPMIKGEEVGYFGGATIAHHIDVFVYSNLGPSAGNRVTVCLAGRCERAHGHNATLAWYRATFTIHGKPMGAPVSFHVTASDAAGEATVRVTKPLLCMHNNGSTPQT